MDYPFSGKPQRRRGALLIRV